MNEPQCVNGATDGVHHVSIDDFNGLKLDGKTNDFDCQKRNTVLSLSSLDIGFVSPLGSPRGGVGVEFVSNFGISNKNGYWPFDLICDREGGHRFSVVPESVSDLSSNDRDSIGVESRENGSREPIAIRPRDSFSPVVNQVGLQLFFDFVTPTGSKFKGKSFCMFTVELAELLVGNCMSIPNETRTVELPVPRLARRGKYQLIAECGNLTAIIDVSGRIVTPTVGSNRNFILRRIQNE